MTEAVSNMGLGAATLLARRGEFLLYVAVAVLVTTVWYRHAPLVWGDDATFPFTTERAATYLHLLDNGLGGPDGRKFPFLLPIGGLLELWRLSGLPYRLTTIQPVLIATLLATGAVSMHLLLQTLLPSLRRTARVVAALVYVFNPYSMTTIWSAMSLLAIEYALLPLVVCTWIVALRRASFTWGLGAALLWLFALTPAYVTTPVALTDSALFAATALLTITAARGRRVRTASVAAVMYGAWLVGALFWMLPLFDSLSAVQSNGLAGGDPRMLFRANSAPLVDAIRLGGYWGTTADFIGFPLFAWRNYYDSVGLPAAGALPVLAVLGLAGSRHLPRPERTLLWWWGGVALCAVFLMTGSHVPLGSAKVAVVGHLGLQGPFRSVYQRFGSYLALAYGPLVAAGVHVALGSMGRIPGRRWFQAGVATLIAVLVTVLPAWPMWNGSLLDRSGWSPARRIQPPPDYARVAKLIDSTPGDFDVLTLPFSNASGIITLAWDGVNEGYAPRQPVLGYHGIDPLTLMLHKGVVTYDPTAPYQYDWAAAVVHGRRALPNALRLLNARFVVLHLDESIPYLVSSGRWVGVAIRKAAARLDRRSDLKLVYASYTLRVYLVKNWRPFRVFAMPRRPLKGGMIAQPLRAVPYRRNSAGSFTLDTSALSRHDILVVNRPYDDRWRASSFTPRTIYPGLPGFAAPRSTALRVHFLPETQVRRYLRLLPISVGALLVAFATLLALGRKRRRQP